MKIEINNLGKNFGIFKALNNINLTVENGELIALLGPSGCGKTTLLRIIAGLDYADEGGVKFISDYDTTKRNNVGFVFQHYALFKHMTVFENIAFGLRVKPRNERPDKNEIKNKVNSLLELIQMEWGAKRYPHQLSGGQRQRVALARALAIEPKMLLLDEPFGALDAKVRKELRKWLRHLHEQIKVTSIFVTHDQEEALELADRVVLMNNGEIIQTGTPKEVYENPANPFVFDFLGNVNKFSESLIDRRASPTGEKIVFVRPHDITLSSTIRDASFVKGSVKEIFYLGSIIKLELEVDGHFSPVEAEISMEVFNDLRLNKKDEIYLKFNNYRVYDESQISL